MKLKLLLALVTLTLCLCAFAKDTCEVQGQLYTNGASYAVGDKVHLFLTNNQFKAVTITAIECNGGGQYTTKITVKNGSKTEVIKPGDAYILSGCDGAGAKQLCIGDKRTFYTYMPRSNVIDGSVEGKVIAFSAIVVIIKLPNGNIDWYTKDATFP